MEGAVRQCDLTGVVGLGLVAEAGQGAAYLLDVLLVPGSFSCALRASSPMRRPAACAAVLRQSLTGCPVRIDSATPVARREPASS
jgi:hypothetical protein